MTGRGTWFAGILAALMPGVAGAQSDLAKALTRLEAVLEVKNPPLVQSLQPPLTISEIAALEAQYDIVLPDAVKVLYRWHDGQNPENFDTFVNNMQFQPLETALRTKVELDGMIGYDFTLENWWNPAWLPIFHNGGGDFLVVDMAGVHTGNVNQLLTVYHDWEYRPIVAEDLAAFMEGAVAYYDGTAIEDMDEFHDIEGFLPELKRAFSASGPVAPLE